MSKNTSKKIFSIIFSLVGVLAIILFSGFLETIFDSHPSYDVLEIIGIISIAALLIFEVLKKIIKH